MVPIRDLGSFGFPIVALGAAGFGVSLVALVVALVRASLGRFIGIGAVVLGVFTLWAGQKMSVAIAEPGAVGPPPTDRRPFSAEPRLASAEYTPEQLARTVRARCMQSAGMPLLAGVVAIAIATRRKRRVSDDADAD
jgi:hypothetical protein